jgi:dTDP-4-amino-4,6-dideoxygalactose transaminase
MIVTNDQQTAERLKVLRAHGSKPKYFHKVIGGNFRLDALQAAIVSTKLPYLNRWTAARKQNAKLYDLLFVEAGLTQLKDSFYHVDLPKVTTNRHIYNQYVIRVQRRDQLQAFLKEKGIGTEVFYPVPMHAQECFAYLGQREGAFPESERDARETVAIPVYPELTEAQQRYVVTCIKEFMTGENPDQRFPEPAPSQSTKA